MPEPDSIWVTSKWQAAELDKQSIEFRIPLKGRRIGCGTGTLLARSRIYVDDRIAVEIEIKHLVGRWQERQVIFQVPQKYVDCIEPHPSQDIAKFRLMVA
jgi:hypothetical protein